jgi:hypothetical protein
MTKETNMNNSGDQETLEDNSMGVEARRRAL